MKRHPSRRLAALIRETLRSVEQRSGLTPGDPELLELKRTLLLRLAALEFEPRDSAVPAPAGRAA